MTEQQLREGASVLVKALKKLGVVEAVLGGGKFRVAVGSLKMTCSTKELEASSVPPRSTTAAPIKTQARRAPPSPSLDLHGMRVDDAIRKLDQWLDDVILSELSSVKVIHGLGTGRVQEAVHKHLAALKAVRHFRINDRNPGETDVYL
jgi:DNA mismatch repair protein MutS2